MSILFFNLYDNLKCESSIKHICNALRVADMHGHFDRDRASEPLFEKRPFPVNFWFGKVVTEKILDQIRLIFPYLPKIQQNKTFCK